MLGYFAYQHYKTFEIGYRRQGGKIGWLFGGQNNGSTSGGSGSIGSGSTSTGSTGGTGGSGSTDSSTSGTTGGQEQNQSIQNLSSLFGQGTIIYTNNQYGFDFALPSDWQGYSIVNSQWQGYAVSGSQGDVTTSAGPQILIRNPHWTQARPYQDIPIMVFTLAQWDEIIRGIFHIGAAPVNPMMLGYSARYVFALPARYNYAFPLGWQEVEQILQNKPLAPISPVIFDALPAESQLLLCAGIPNNSVMVLPETTRLFINLPKDVFPDKNNNLKFTAVAASGNAQANWISNAGPYGEAFGALQPGDSSQSIDCWSYYYELDGTGELDLTATGAPVSGVPGMNYFVKFLVQAH